jgi:hypothetical protein
MRADRVPWLSPTGASDSPWLTSSSPDPASDGKKPVRSARLSEEKEMELERPRHTSESYTNFDLSVAGDARYVNASGGFRESCPDSKC